MRARPTGTDLREAWQAGTLSTTWVRPDDWFHPAVDALTEALSTQDDPTSAAERLGRARGYAGVGLGETIADVSVLLRLPDVDAEPLEIMCSVCRGWSTGYEEGAEFAHWRDPAAGTHTIGYLRTRLDEEYGAATRTGRRVPDTHRLIILDLGTVPIADAWARAAQLALIGRCIENVFGPGRPVAMLSDSVLAMLADADDPAVRNATALGRAYAQCLFGSNGHTVRVWVEPLPPTLDSALDLLDSLVR